jgi:hypothetical protein
VSGSLPTGRSHPRSMWSSTAVLTLLILTHFADPATIHAQRVDLDVRGTGAIPIGKFAGASLDPGIGFGATIAYRVGSRLFVYGGWDGIRLSAKESFAGTDRTIEESGYALGFRLETAAADGVRYRIEAGPTYQHVVISADDGDLAVESRDRWGAELAAGLVLPLNDSWKMTPSLRVRLLGTEFSLDGVETRGTLRYAALDYGLSYVF